MKFLIFVNKIQMMNILIKKFGDKNKYITFIKEYKY